MTPAEAEIMQVARELELKSNRKETLKKVRKHARETRPFVEEIDYDYSFLRARSPFEFVEWGEKSYLMND